MLVVLGEETLNGSRMRLRLRFLPSCLEVHRLPSEHRVSPSLASMRVVAPSLAEVATVASAFGLQSPPAKPRRIAAVRIVSALCRLGLLADEKARHEFLDRRRAESIAVAVEGCAASDRLLAKALGARCRWSAAEAAGEPEQVRLPLAREADRTAVLVAKAFVRASRRCEEVEGIILVMEHLAAGMAEGQVGRQGQAGGQRSPAHGRRPHTIQPPRFVGGGHRQQCHDKTKGSRAKGPPHGID